jgi:hypothetical protein
LTIWKFIVKVARFRLDCSETICPTVAQIFKKERTDLRVMVWQGTPFQRRKGPWVIFPQLFVVVEKVILVDRSLVSWLILATK